MRRLIVAVVVAELVLTACVSGNDDSEPPVSVVGSDYRVELAHGEQFPEILDVEASHNDGSNTWDFAVTVSSPYDSPSRYADGWRVLGPDGTVYGVHTLTHDHAAEQPFTRRQYGVEIPADVDEVTIEGRDLVNGFGGSTRTIDLQAPTS